jgi:5'-nucleotidase
MQDTRPLILMTNDDGVHAAGLMQLRQVLCSFADVVVVAPAAEKSGCSHSITLREALHHTEYEPGVHAIDGTPADCVYLALYHETFLPRRPDLVVSGLNHGVNLGTDVYYSGTVAGAREGVLRGIPAMAMSFDGHKEFDGALALCKALVQRMLTAEKPDGWPPLLNVNLPRGRIQGVRATCLGRRMYHDPVTVRRDATGRMHFFVAGRPYHEDVEGADTEALEQGYASVTPLVMEGSHPAHLALAAAVAAGPLECDPV